ncbi:hypothetical protein TBLA_0E01690 [Henningerozyma blattae CBS 6284]|uniref:Serine/threonine-protein phosphatase 2A activator n=1 Tax=Henningerozyma blattae (strain ATCC 34711 / CBS 6284 / DSM 70876 / NBRC 10599 / NRRL Y-10934 / UCD 77-7) TaxID=1071380 RepID=I2H4C4_HENB6|nr:hypothetical protein TBLA_0E01690 [Tetrapisispora blattae CBS 6284]CCH61226.1 hypothetical protein TBLA_0E01690 [Tetrapisispora blattae CBS 6284]
MESIPIYKLDSNCVFSAPTKQIFDSQGTQYFNRSIAFHRIQYFISKYTQLIQEENIPPTDYTSSNDTISGVSKIINDLIKLVEETPPLPGPRRYGNLSCRQWHKRVDDNINELFEKYLTISNTKFNKDQLFLELIYYFNASLGSPTRLDYGTGHELSFLAFIGALDMLNLLTDISGTDILFIFNEYYRLIRKLILNYTLEPAGSHGVWGLDDHFHLIYIFGSSQWCPENADMTEPSISEPKFKAPIKPVDILNKNLIEKFKSSNFYCQSILFILTVKTGPFPEHSPILFDIAKNVHNWKKVRSGLLKMYMVEVLNKFPVVQHFWFGTGFYPWINSSTLMKLPTYELAPDDNNTTYTINKPTDLSKSGSKKTLENMLNTDKEKIDPNSCVTTTINHGSNRAKQPTLSSSNISTRKQARIPNDMLRSSQMSSEGPTAPLERSTNMITGMNPPSSTSIRHSILRTNRNSRNNNDRTSNNLSRFRNNANDSK